MTDETPRITRDDIEQGLRDVTGEVKGQAKAQAPKIVPVAVGAGLLFLLVAYLLGKRVGTTKSTVVEIRRI